MAGLAVLLTVLVPGFMLYTTAYMTEVPAFAMEVSSLAIGAIAIHRSSGRHRWIWLIVSLAVGCYAFAIREYAIAAPIAVSLPLRHRIGGSAGSHTPSARRDVVGVRRDLRVHLGLPGQGPRPDAPTPGTTRRVLDSVNSSAWRSRRRS